MVVALALGACVAFAMSVQGGRWWVISETEVGPFGAKRCFDDGCVPAKLSFLGVGDRWMRVGMGAWAAGLISAFLLVVMSAGLAAKRVPRLVAKTVLVSIGTAAITGTWFTVQFPHAEFSNAELGRGALLFVLAIAAAAGAAIFVLRAPKPT